MGDEVADRLLELRQGAELPHLSYFVCATPRSGSSLLSGLLKSTGVAGRPNEYFSDVYEHRWAERWGASSPTEYIDAAIGAGMSMNRVFGAKVMWAHMPAVLLRMLRAANGNRRASEREMLEHAFPNLHFVSLWREDVIAQAVSFARALQTREWESVHRGMREPRFDHELIDEVLGWIVNGDDGWERWFEANRIDPLRIRYEDLAEDPRGVARSVLAYLGIELPDSAVLHSPLRKQGDELNAEWIARYKAIVGGRMRRDRTSSTARA